MSDCEEYRELVGSLIDGEITAEDERRLREHLSSCPSCVSYALAYKGISDSFSGSAPEPTGEPAPDVTPRTRDGNRRARRARGGCGRSGWIALAACVAVILVAVSLFLRFSGGSGGTVPAPVTTASAAVAGGSDAGDAQLAASAPPYDNGTAEAPAAPPSAVPGDESAEYRSAYFVIITIQGDLPDFLSSYPEQDMGDGTSQIVVPRDVISPLMDGSYDIQTGNEQAASALIIYIP